MMLKYCFIASMILYGVPSFFIFPYILGRKFDRIMQQHNLAIPQGFGIFPPHIVRTTVYAINIVVFPNPKKYPNKMKQYKHWFGNFWFRAHASTCDKIQAWYIFITAVFFVITVFFIVIS